MEKLLTPAEVSEITGIKVGALAQLRYMGTGPRFRALTPKNIRYSESDVATWIEDSARTKTGELVSK